MDFSRLNRRGLTSLDLSLTFVFILAGYIFTHLKFDFRVPGYNWNRNFERFILPSSFKGSMTYTLNSNIPYAKHAISIDENRKDFRRVGWDPGENDRPARDKKGNIFFEQVWFPGNHADIGGGYEETVAPVRRRSGMDANRRHDNSISNQV